jgi:hypothetical protein
LVEAAVGLLSAHPAAWLRVAIPIGCLCACGGADTDSSGAVIAEVLRPSDEQLAESQRATVLRAEAETAECMTSRGFDYQAVPPERRLEVRTLSDRERAASSAASDGYGLTVAVEVAEEDTWVDPNIEHLDALSSAQRAAWLLALLGTSAQPGCQRGVVSESDAAHRIALVQEMFSSEMDELEQRVFADDRVVEGQAAWVDCMREQGFDYVNPGQPIKEFTMAISEQPSEGELVEVQHRERLVAAADAQCPFNNFGGWERVLDEVYDEVYDEFIAEHEAELLAVLEAS